MSTVIIQYEAKCKHCDHFGSIKNGKRRQSYCNLLHQPLTLKSKRCDKFQLMETNPPPILDRQQFNSWVDKNYIEVSIGHYVNISDNQDCLYTTKELISVYLNPLTQDTKNK